MFVLSFHNLKFNILNFPMTDGEAIYSEVEVLKEIYNFNNILMYYTTLHAFNISHKNVTTIFKW